MTGVVSGWAALVSFDNAVPPTGHPDECTCRACLMHDMDMALIVNGHNPADYPIDPRVGQLLHVSGSGRAGARGRGWAPTQEDIDAEPLPAATVLVADVFPGVWARFTGADPTTGEPVVISGAVVAGATIVDIDGKRQVAVKVRDYRGNPDRVVVAAPDAAADLTDDPADRPAKRRWLREPVSGPAEAVLLLHRRSGWYDHEIRSDVTPQRLAELEANADPGAPVLLGAVYRAEIPIVEENTSWTAT